MHTTLKLAACGLFIGVALSACGGGGGGAAPPAAQTEVPDEAKASSEGLTAWARAQQASETGEPLSMGTLETAPSSETIEPASLD